MLEREALAEALVEGGKRYFLHVEDFFVAATLAARYARLFKVPENPLEGKALDAKVGGGDHLERGKVLDILIAKSRGETCGPARQARGAQLDHRRARLIDVQQTAGHV